MRRILSRVGGLLIGLSVAALNGRAGDFRLESVGVRSGFSANRGTRAGLLETEAFANWHLPWDWDIGRDWSVRPRLDLAAGWLGGLGDDAFIGSIGPSLVVGRKDFPLALVGGLSPTVLTRSSFGNWDIGIPFQFTSHLGLSLDLGRHLDLGYRFQHMSNAHLSEQNPGLNFHMFWVGYRF